MATGGVIAGVMVGLYIATKFWYYFPSNARSIDIGGRTHAIFGRWNYRGGVRSEESFSILWHDYFSIDRNFRLVDFKIGHELWF